MTDLAPQFVVPQQLQSLSLLVHANAKVGKTTLAATSPAPILAIDAEGGWKFMPFPLRYWDPMREAPPRYDGTWQVCQVIVRDWTTMKMVHTRLLQYEHDFQSIVVDSITEVQRRCKENLVGTEGMKIQDWGRILTEMDGIIRGLRDLTLHPVHPLRVATFIAETRMYNGRYKPAMQGQIVDALPYWCDIVGYLYTQPTLDANGQPSGDLIRRLLITPNELYEAGERVQGRLGGVIDSPNITEMYMRVFQLNQLNGHQPT